MELEVKMPVNLSDGQHKGNIVELQSKTIQNKKGEVIPFFDIIIETEGVKIKYGASQNLTPNSKLGKLVAAFTPLESGKKIDITGLLLGKTVSFLTMKNEQGYTDIVVGSVKPA